MSPTLLSIAAASLLGAAPSQFKLALGSISSVQTSPELSLFVTEHLAEELRAKGFRVTTSGDMAAVLGLERQKALLGCTDGNTSCMAELASALGVDAILTGQFAKLGATYQLDVKALSAKDGTRLAGWSGAIADDGAILEALREAAQALAGQLEQTPALKPNPNPQSQEPRKTADPVLIREPAPSPPTTHPLRGRAWIPAAAGAGVLATGIALFSAGHNDYMTLNNAKGMPLTDWNRYKSEGPILEKVGVTGMILGGAGLIAAGAFLFWPGSDNRVALSVGPRGFAVTGALP